MRCVYVCACSFFNFFFHVFWVFGGDFVVVIHVAVHSESGIMYVTFGEIDLVISSCAVCTFVVFKRCAINAHSQNRIIAPCVKRRTENWSKVSLRAHMCVCARALLD